MDHPNFFDEECDYRYVTDCSARNWVCHPYFVLYNNLDQGIGPPTLKTWLRPWIVTVVITVVITVGCDLQHLISSTFRPSTCQLLVVAPFRLPVLRSGTAYQMTSPPLSPCQPSGAIWRHIYSAAVTTLTDTACTYSDYSGPRSGVAA